MWGQNYRSPLFSNEDQIPGPGVMNVALQPTELNLIRIFGKSQAKLMASN